MSKHGKRRGDGLGVTRVEPQDGLPGGFAIVHPRCARRRRADMEEVQAMLDAGETEIAREELVWLLSECPDFLEAHLHLGLLALEEHDPKLARGHFGRVYELVLKAVEAAGNPSPLPCALPANEPFWQAAKGLVHCLATTGRRSMAKTVVERVVALDPSDPLGIAKLLQQQTQQPSGKDRSRRG